MKEKFVSYLLSEAHKYNVSEWDKILEAIGSALNIELENFKV